MDVRECEIAERFLDRADERSFDVLFRHFSPQLVAFFRKRGHGLDIAEDLAQEVMLTVYRKAGQLRNRQLFRAWLFRIARHAASRHIAHRMRQVQTVSVANENELLAVPDARPPAAMAFEFGDWMNYLEPLERETMVLRFVEEWEYHEIAAEQAVPIGTVQWRVFNSKKKLAARLNPCRDEGRRAA